jgi:hypothetical protein
MLAGENLESLKLEELS